MREILIAENAKVPDTNPQHSQQMVGQHVFLKRHIAVRKDRLFSVMVHQIRTDSVDVIILEVMTLLPNQRMVAIVFRQLRIVLATRNLVHLDLSSILVSIY